jgi:regulator of replication initiation timing
MVKDLMQTNRDFMVQVEAVNKEKESLSTETFHLSMENRELRDRIEILESVVATSNFGSEDLNNLDWREVFSEEL